MPVWILPIRTPEPPPTVKSVGVLLITRSHTPTAQTQPRAGSVPALPARSSPAVLALFYGTITVILGRLLEMFGFWVVPYNCPATTTKSPTFTV